MEDINGDTVLLAEYLKQAYAEVLLETAPSFDYDRAWHRVAERAKERKGKPMSVTVKPEIREHITKTGLRMLTVEKPYLAAVQFPAGPSRNEEWRIVVGLDSAFTPASVSSEADARAWLTFLATHLT